MHRDIFLNTFWLVGGALALAAPWAFGSLDQRPAPRDAVQRVTQAPAGPFHVDGRRILDSKRQPFLIRGTQLAPFNPRTLDHDNRAGLDYGAHSATTFSAIRLRYNFNAVRLPLNVKDADEPGYFDNLDAVVQRANDVELLVILAARGAATKDESAAFWARCASYFRESPNVMFEPSPAPAAPPGLEAHSKEGWRQWRAEAAGLVGAIRSAGARQPVVVNAWDDGSLFAGLGADVLLDEPNVIYQASPRYVSTRSDADRDRQLGLLARHAPVLAAGWDLELDDSEACAAIPADPSAAARLVRDNLDYFDREGISWTVSEFVPGKLVKDLSEHDATRLDLGWDCYTPNPTGPAGIGRIVQAHMRATDEHGLFVVSGSGGMVIGRGAFAIAYGPIMAERESVASGPDAPTSLGRISIEVTDSRGVSRPSQMLWAGPGWGQTNFAVPDDSAVGPAKLRISREDGSSLETNITIADTAPAFFTGYSCRGAARGEVLQIFADGRSEKSALASCSGPDCRTAPIPLSDDSKTIVRLYASGVRHARGLGEIGLTVGGRPVPLLSHGADTAGDPGRDLLVFEVPPELRGLGETDMICRINGRISNVVRVQLGS